MVKSETLVSSFVQSTHSCLLTSYAIVSNHYTGIAKDEYFKDYCKHYNMKINTEIKSNVELTGININDENIYEYAYYYHFRRECQRQKIAGLKLIENLHKASDQKSFVDSRNKFDVEYISIVSSKLHEIESRLKEQDALLVCAFNEGRHIAVFGYDTNGWYTVETRPTENPGIKYMSCISEFCELGDALLSTKKST